MGNCCNGRSYKPPLITVPNSTHSDYKSNTEISLRHLDSIESISISTDLPLHILNIKSSEKLNKSTVLDREANETINVDYEDDMFYQSIEDPDSEYIDTMSKRSISKIRRLSTLKEDGLEGLYYSLDESYKLTSEQQRIVLGFFHQYEHETVSALSEEQLDGAITVKQKTQTGHIDVILLLSTFAVYLIDPLIFHVVQRRIRLDSILLLGLNKSRTDLILHIFSSDLLGDIWVTCKDINNLLKAFQVLHRNFTSRYIPAYTLNTLDELSHNYNTMLTTQIYSYHTPEILRITSVLCKEGLIGENILLFHRSTRITRSRGFEECVAVLTDYSLYSLKEDYEFIDKIGLQYMKMICVVDKCDRIIIQSDVTEDVLWFWNVKAADKIQEASMKLLKKKIAQEFVAKEDADEIMEYLTTPQSALLPKENTAEQVFIQKL